MVETLTPKALERMFESVKNWGRWGPQDERGALNFITPAHRAAAAALALDGEAVSCSLEFPVAPGPENPTPAQHHMVLGGDARPISGAPVSSSLSNSLVLEFVRTKLRHERMT